MPNFTSIYSQSYTGFPDTNPVGSPFSASGALKQLRVLSGLLCASGTIIQGGFGKNTVTVLNNDQYVKVVIGSMGASGASLTANLRDNSTDTTYIQMSLLATGGVVKVQDFWNGGATLINVTGVTFTPGDVYTFYVVGGAVGILRNGVSFATGTGVTVAGTQNFTSLSVHYKSVITDTSFSLYEVGNASTIGNPTAGTVGIGSFSGNSFGAAFTNLQNLDVVQVVNEGGNVVWNLSSNGVANPGSTTQGALFTYYGSSFAQAFMNPQNLDVLQVVQAGGNVVFSVDYQGNAGSH